VAHTQVGIIGAGPAGLILGLLLEREGIETTILELRDREYVEGRVRAGLLEQNTVDLLCELGAGERLLREGFRHSSFEVRLEGQRHHIQSSELTGGRDTWMYGQREVVRDLVKARVESGAPLFFEALDVEVDELKTDQPRIRYCQDGEDRVLTCDVIAGCDGFHGVSRRSIPDSAIATRSLQYPFAWLGFLADAPPATTDELIYAHHPNGFALHSFRSLELSRLYLQVAPDEDLAPWSDDRLWSELRTRLATDDEWELNEGPIHDLGTTSMRSFVAEPMQYGNLFLAGDAAHIVPPTAAKGLNLAVADVWLLAAALVEHLKQGSRDSLDRYSEVALRRVWQVQAFSWEMTNTFHHIPGDEFAKRIQQAQLNRLCTSEPYMKAFCEAYVGRPYERVAAGP
jgi:p-hydroxybenzoate 3-monooxygenase